MLPVTGLYAGLLAIGFVWLATRVVKARRQYRVALGTSHRMVERAVRAHGNFAEYVPFALLLLALNEVNGLPDWALHVLGVVMLAGRALHAHGIGREPEDIRWRVMGMALTFLVLLAGAASLLGLSLATLLAAPPISPSVALRVRMHGPGAGTGIARLAAFLLLSEAGPVPGQAAGILLPTHRLPLGAGRGAGGVLAGLALVATDVGLLAGHGAAPLR